MIRLAQHAKTIGVLLAVCAAVGALLFVYVEIRGRLADPVGAVVQGVEARSGGPLVEVPGRDAVAFSDSAGTEIIPVDMPDLDAELELAVEVDAGEEKKRFVVFRQRSWFPDITGMPSVGIRSVGSSEGVRVTAQSTPLLSFQHQVSVGASYSDAPGVVAALSPVQVWAFRPYVFGGVFDPAQPELDGGVGISTRITPAVRIGVQYGLSQNPSVSLLIDL
jgi:hypothetical protein